MGRKIASTAAVTTGALAGAMTVIRVVLVPFWQRSLDSEFKPWFVENAPRLRALMVPLGAVATGATTTNALITSRHRAVLGAAAAAGVAVVTMAVNEPLNARFEGPEPVEAADLDRWVRWHDVRLALGLVAAWSSAGTGDRGHSSSIRR
jgi:Domain of unknown function (DUF1772)